MFTSVGLQHLPVCAEMEAVRGQARLDHKTHLTGTHLSQELRLGAG